MRLTDLSPNECASIVVIKGGYSIRRLACGCTVTTFSGRLSPAVVRLDGETLVLGHGTAEKIQVRRV